MQKLFYAPTNSAISPRLSSEQLTRLKICSERLKLLRFWGPFNRPSPTSNTLERNGRILAMKNDSLAYLSQAFVITSPYWDSLRYSTTSGISSLRRMPSGRLFWRLILLPLLLVSSLLALSLSLLILLLDSIVATVLTIYVLFERTIKTLSRPFSKMLGSIGKKITWRGTAPPSSTSRCEHPKEQ